jgi:hypothetical protein
MYVCMYVIDMDVINERENDSGFHQLLAVWLLQVLIGLDSHR